MVSEKGSLDRLLRPRSVAVVGASDRVRNPGVLRMLEGDLDVHLVNPRRATVHGRAASPDLAAIGRPVDAVFSLVDAAGSVAVAREAAATGAGGLVVVAGGFSELGAPGVALQAELCEAVGNKVPLIGPNCNGVVSVVSGSIMTAAPPLRLQGGGIGVVTHTGAVFQPCLQAGRERGIGFSHLVSTGNEALTDIADVLEFLVDDPATRVICLIVERLGRPREFLAAARRARAAGKPVIALKLGRGRKARALAESHTGTIVGEAWTYDAAFRQYGILAARDFDDLLDRAALFDQLERWPRVAGLAVLSTSGGTASLASDVCEQEGVPIPELPALADDVADLVARAGRRESVPTPVNPVDLTGFIGGQPELVREATARYAADPAVDSLLFLFMLDPDSRPVAEPIIEAAVAGAGTTPIVVAGLEDGPIGDWVAPLLGPTAAFGRGLRSTVRGVAALRELHALAPIAPVPRPARTLPRPGQLVQSEVGEILPFARAMALLRDAGIPTAPFRLIADNEDLRELVGLSAPLVAKLADVPHRTEIGAVRHVVSPADLPRAVEELRALAEREGVPGDIVLQPRIASGGEAIVGIQGATDLGPVVVCGLGGVFVELLEQVAGRLAPIGREEALRMLDDLPANVLDGHRDAPSWDRRALASIVAATSALAAAAPWLHSLDINPLIAGPTGFVAVDALCVIAPEGSARCPI